LRRDSRVEARDRYQQKLNSFKQREQPETILLVAKDSLLVKIAVAWTNTSVRRARRLSPLDGDSEEEVWQWLWRNTRFSREEFIKRIPSSDRRIDRLIDSLISNRILYPDGTIHSYLKGYLRNTVVSLFQKGLGKNPKERSGNPP